MVEQLARKMKANGIVPEIEIFDLGMINTVKVFISRGILTEPFYYNILAGSIFSAPATLFDLAYLVGSLPPGGHWGAAGIGRFQLKMNLAAILMGGNVRVGLEDNIYYDTGKNVLATNVMLIERLVRLCQEVGREIATPSEARALLGLPDRACDWAAVSEEDSLAPPVFVRAGAS
jgi:uncharacterized protein (DUF849 family)